ncbi:MAG: SIR2 family protein [Bdellovibrionaceae bacterium]|nr:SIR2 family protein [Pseudobdellovibrionaceae bacterium]
MEIPKYLIDQITEGNVVLFLGSGASVGAIHENNEKVPIGQNLSDLIAEKFLGEKFKNQSLQYVAELAISETDLFTVQKFIADIFRKFKPNDHHKIIPTLIWKSIITTNYDLIIEDAYFDTSKAQQELAVFVKDGERVRDKITSSKSLPYYKIHGCINHINDISLPLILTPEQFITHKENRERLFSRILELGRDYTFLFVGFSFADYDIRLMLSELDKLKDGKPRSYMVGPFIKDEESRLWDKKKVTSIKCGFDEFLNAVDKNINPTLRVLGSSKPVNEHPLHSKFAISVSEVKPSENFQSFVNNDVEFIHKALKAPATDPKEFYKGYFENWDPIINNLDVRRTILDGILSEAFLSDEYNSSISQNLFLINGHAGSGKSVILKRLAWDAATSFEKICLFYKPNAGLKYEPLAELFNYCKERIYLFIDNAFSNAEGIKLLLDKAKKDKLPLTIITGERTNVWNADCAELEKYLTQDFHVKYLNDKEIIGLIDLLEKHNSLYTLKTASLTERINAFSEKAGRELLVALYEATSGKPFALKLELVLFLECTV